MSAAEDGFGCHLKNFNLKLASVKHVGGHSHGSHTKAGPAAAAGLRGSQSTHD